MTPMKISPGDLDQRVTIRRQFRIPDGGGGYEESWTDLAPPRWAKVKPLSGRERDVANQTESPRNYRVTMRRDSVTATITEADILVWRERDMNIRFIADAGPRPLYLTFDVELGVAI